MASVGCVFRGTCSDVPTENVVYMKGYLSGPLLLQEREFLSNATII